MTEPQKALHDPEERAQQADRMIVEALDRMVALVLDMKAFNDIDNGVPALETFERWETDGLADGRCFCSSEILTELVDPVGEAHNALIDAYNDHPAHEKDASSSTTTVEEPQEVEGPAEPESADSEKKKPITGEWAHVELRKALPPVKALSKQFNAAPLTWDGAELSHNLQEVAEDLSFLSGKAIERLDGMEPPSINEIENTYLHSMSMLAAIQLLGRHLGVTGCCHDRVHEFAGDYNIPEKWYMEALVYLTNEVSEWTKDPEMFGRRESLDKEYRERKEATQ